MAKQLIHVGVAVSTDGFLPGRANLINLAAAVGQLGKFNTNITPQNGTYGESPFWAKHPEEFAELKDKPVPLETAMAQFRLWLKQWQGTLVACTSAMDFWHLAHALFATGKDCPFGPTPLDTNSYCAGLEARKTIKRLAGAVRPMEVALERWRLVTEGKIPKFGNAKRDKGRFAWDGVPTPRIRFRPGAEVPATQAPEPPPVDYLATATAAYRRALDVATLARENALQQAQAPQAQNLPGTGTLFANFTYTQ